MLSQIVITKKAMRHLEDNHPEISREMVVQAFYEEYACPRPADRGCKFVLGQADGGALLTIIGKASGTTLRMITCRGMTDKEKAFYHAKRRRRMG